MVILQLFIRYHFYPSVLKTPDPPCFSPMRIKHLMLLATAAMAISTTTSCSNEPYVITAEEEYTRNFIKSFGIIDPNQDWNLAQSSDVTVKVGDAPSHVKAYMKVGDKYYIVADLKDVSGNVSIPFDMPEGTNDILVKINGKRYYTNPGGIVDPANPKSRVLIEPGEGDAAQVSWVDYRLYTAGEIFPIIYPNDERWPDYYNGLGELRQNTYPDSDPRSHGIIPEGDPKNYDNPYVIMDFWFKDVDDNGLTIYPMYWNTDKSYHTIGIFYFVKDGKYCAPGTEGATMVRQDLFEDKNHNDNPLQLLDCGSPNSYKNLDNITLEDINAAFNKSYSDIITAKQELLTIYKLHTAHPEWGNSWYEMSASNAKILFEYLKSTKPDKYTNDYFSLLVGSWDNNSYGNIETYGNKGCAISGNAVFDWTEVAVDHTYASRGINIKVPSDLQFGFYLKRESGDEYGYFYSITDYNCAAYQTEDDAIAKWTEDANNSYSDPVITNKPFACTYKHPASNNWFFSFEDAATATQYWDLNDLMFGVLGNFNVDDDDYREIEHEETKESGEEEEDEPYDWLLAVEDLGVTDDFDFNDIIIGISAVTTNDVTEEARKVGNALNGQYNKVTFKALAAGGTLPAYVYYDDVLLYPDGHEDRAEWHKWFGNGSYSHTTMINTNAAGADNLTGAKCTVYFGSKDGSKYIFSLEKFESEGGSVDAYDSGFKIGIDKAEKTSSEISQEYFDTDENGYFVKPSSAGAAPQMFLIPDKWTKVDGSVGKWQWPVERNHIQSCYNGFKEWVINAKETTWYQNPGSGVCRPSK